MTSDARQKTQEFTLCQNVIWANQKTESFEYHWLRALAMFDVKSFPTILSGIGRHFKLCRYVNWACGCVCFRYYVETITQLRDTATVELFYLCAKQQLYKVHVSATLFFFGHICWELNTLALHIKFTLSQLCMKVGCTLSAVGHMVL